MKKLTYTLKCNGYENASNTRGVTVQISKPNGSSSSRSKTNKELTTEIETLKQENETFKNVLSDIIDNLVEVSNFTGNESYFFIKKQTNQ